MPRESLQSSSRKKHKVEEDLLLVQEEDLLLVQEEDPLLVQEEDLLLVQEEDPPMKQFNYKVTWKVENPPLGFFW